MWRLCLQPQSNLIKSSFLIEGRSCLLIHISSFSALEEEFRLLSVCKKVLEGTLSSTILRILKLLYLQGTIPSYGRQNQLGFFKCEKSGKS